MSRRGASGRSVDGSDGTDMAYQRAVTPEDDRFRRVTQGKLTLRKYLAAQTVFQLLKVSMTIFTLLSGEGTVENPHVAACVFGVLSVLIGTLAFKRGTPKLLKTYIFFMSLTVGLSLLPLITGKFYEKMSYLTVYKASKNHQKFAQVSFEGLQDIMGTFVGAQGIYVAQNLLGHMNPQKRRA